jgi:hypothetical protein
MSAGRLVLCLLVLVCLTSAASACPMCKTALGSQDVAQGDIVGAYMWSILFMLSMPFTILGAFSAYMYVQVRKARRMQAAAQQEAANLAHVSVEAPTSSEALEETVGV